MSVKEIIFSPTGGTRKVADIIAQRWDTSPEIIDLSKPETDFDEISTDKDDLVLVAMPSFGGRAPEVAIERLKKISGNGARCVLVCVYGNRAYEDTLVEMEDAAKESGFKVIAAISAIAQHSILPQFASGRPDALDERQLRSFARRLESKTDSVSLIPGNRPYKKGGGATLVPKPTRDCNQCGICVRICPVAAIDEGNFKADAKKCIGCMRCVSICPSEARKINAMMASAAALMLKKTASDRKENELFL